MSRAGVLLQMEVDPARQAPPAAASPVVAEVISAWGVPLAGV
jgi:hypothetical protein